MASSKALAHGVMIGAFLMTLVVGMRAFDLAGTTPLWVFAILIVLGVTFHEPALHRAMTGGDLTRLIGPRMAMRYAVNTAMLYASGWGAALAVVHFFLLSEFLTQSGSRVWRPAAVCSVGTLALGQLAIAAGLFTYLPQPEVHGVAGLIAVGIVLGYRFFGVTVRKREEAESALRESDELLRSMVQDGSDVITLTESDGPVRYVSPNVVRVLGRNADDLLGDAYWDIVHPDDLADARELMAGARAEPRTEHAVEMRLQHADGSWRWHEVVMRNLLDYPGVRAIVGHHRDVHERHTAQDRIAHAATHDALTGLLNAAAAQLALERTLVDGSLGGYPVAALFLDLDGFKQVNDEYGHEAGDDMLRMVAGVLRRCCRERDVVGRLGGDEFLVVLNAVANSAQAEAIAATIIDGITCGQPPDDGRPRVGCSIGIAVADPGTVDARELLRQADTAMYVSKRRGRNGHAIYV